jgi:hypothetical protein
VTKTDFDQPLIFLIVIAIGVAAIWGIISWGLITLGWTGPLGLFKGGVVVTSDGNGGTL